MVIVARGVHTTTHRATVPLGSLTCYFDGLTHLIEQALELFFKRVSARHRAALAGAINRNEAIDAVTDIICGTSGPQPDQLNAMLELHAYANRSWMSYREGRARRRT